MLTLPGTFTSESPMKLGVVNYKESTIMWSSFHNKQCSVLVSLRELTDLSDLFSCHDHCFSLPVSDNSVQGPAVTDSCRAGRAVGYQAASVRSHLVQVLLSKIALKLGGHWSSRGCRLVNQTVFVSTLYPSSLAFVTFDCRHSGLKFTACRGQFGSKAEYRLR